MVGWEPAKPNACGHDVRLGGTVSYLPGSGG